MPSIYYTGLLKASRICVRKIFAVAENSKVPDRELRIKGRQFNTLQASNFSTPDFTKISKAG